MPVAVANQREQALALTLGLPRVPVGLTEQFTVRLMLFDGEGRREILSETHDVKITGRTMVAGAFAEGTGVEHRLDLSLVSLTSGDYLLRFAASAGEACAQRDVRFSVK